MASAQQIADRLGEILDLPGVEWLVDSYFAGGDSPFAGSTFDLLEPGPVGEFTAGDVAAASLLDVRFSPPAVRRLVVEHELDGLLAALPVDVCLWEADDVDVDACFELVVALRRLPDVGITKATKLMARKRPLLCPVYDSVVERVMRLERGPWRVPLAEALRDASLRARFDDLVPATPGPVPSTLRLVDVCIWMVGSNSESAQQARIAAGLAAAPRW